MITSSMARFPHDPQHKNGSINFFFTIPSLGAQLFSIYNFFFRVVRWTIPGRKEKYEREENHLIRKSFSAVQLFRIHLNSMCVCVSPSHSLSPLHCCQKLLYFFLFFGFWLPLTDVSSSANWKKKSIVQSVGAKTSFFCRRSPSTVRLAISKGPLSFASIVPFRLWKKYRTTHIRIVHIELSSFLLCCLRSFADRIDCVSSGCVHQVMHSQMI